MPSSVPLTLVAGLLASQIHVINIEARLAVTLSSPGLAILLLILTLSCTLLTRLKCRN